MLLVLPATTAFSERSASTLRIIKIWFRTPLAQGGLNHSMLFAIYKEMTEKLSLIAVANEFCFGSDEHSCLFGLFC